MTDLHPVLPLYSAFDLWHVGLRMKRETSSSNRYVLSKFIRGEIVFTKERRTSRRNRMIGRYGMLGLCTVRVLRDLME